jgi:hypothetical protein
MCFHPIKFFVVLLIVTVLTAQGLRANEPELDNASLWLPKAYSIHFKKLNQAAIFVKDTEKCHRLLSGKLLEGRSKPDQLVFTFRCRTIERYSFSIEFDDNTRQITDPYEPFRLREEQARRLEEAQQRLLNQKIKQQLLQKELDRRQQERADCLLAMQQRIKEFNQPNVINDSLSESIVGNGISTYRLDFDSMSSNKKRLYYKVVCKVVADDDYQLRASPRAEAWSAANN